MSSNATGPTPPADDKPPGRFSKVPREIVRDHRISDGAKVCYAAILAFAWGKGVCWPSNAKIADEAGWITKGGKPSREKVKRHLRELESLGIISRVIGSHGKALSRDSITLPPPGQIQPTPGSDLTHPRVRFDPPPGQIQPTPGSDLTHKEDSGKRLIEADPAKQTQCCVTTPATPGGPRTAHKWEGLTGQDQIKEAIRESLRRIERESRRSADGPPLVKFAAHPEVKGLATAEKASEDQIRFAMEHLGLGFFFWDGHGPDRPDRREDAVTRIGETLAACLGDLRGLPFYLAVARVVGEPGFDRNTIATAFRAGLAKRPAGRARTFKSMMLAREPRSFSAPLNDPASAEVPTTAPVATNATKGSPDAPPTPPTPRPPDRPEAPVPASPNRRPGRADVPLDGPAVPTPADRRKGSKPKPKPDRKPKPKPIGAESSAELVKAWEDSRRALGQPGSRPRLEISDDDARILSPVADNKPGQEEKAKAKRHVGDLAGAIASGAGPIEPKVKQLAQALAYTLNDAASVPFYEAIGRKIGEPGLEPEDILAAYLPALEKPRGPDRSKRFARRLIPGTCRETAAPNR